MANDRGETAHWSIMLIRAFGLSISCGIITGVCYVIYLTVIMYGDSDNAVER